MFTLAGLFRGTESEYMVSPSIQSFIKDMEAQVLMDNIAPENLSIIATNAMQMAAEYKTADQDEKKQAERVYFVAIVLMRQLQQQAAQLREDIIELEEQLNKLEERQLEIARFLDEIDNLTGSNGEYERRTALDIIERITGNRPEDSISDAEIKALLAFEQDQLRTEQNDLEEEVDSIRHDIAINKERLGRIEQQITDLETGIHNPEISLEALGELSEEIKASEPNEQASTAEMKLDALGI